MSPLERVQHYVNQYDPTIKAMLFEEKLQTSEEAAQALGVDIGQIAKSILFRSSGRYGLFVAAGDVRIHAKRVKQCLEGGQPKMASPEEVIEVTGFQVGAVCPFALRQEVPVFVDSSLERFPVVYTAAGIAESLLPVTFQALVAMTGAQVVDMQTAE
ncbi:YbaK/EbsC family protein [Brevibacillus ruminantium]|nr:YbaK/EbsC family protein [Brevibacillus ruminantium]